MFYTHNFGILYSYIRYTRILYIRKLAAAFVRYRELQAMPHDSIIITGDRCRVVRQINCNNYHPQRTHTRVSDSKYFKRIAGTYLYHTRYLNILL